MSLPLELDGCIRSNVPMKPYTVIFVPQCEHARMRGAQVIVTATGPAAALDYARRWIRLARLVPAGVAGYENGTPQEGGEAA